MVNETEAPTSGSTQTAVGKIASSGLSLDELNFCTVVEMFYHNEGGLISVEKAEQIYGFDGDTYQRNLQNNKILVYLSERGINVSHYRDVIDKPEAFRNSVLTPVQLLVANTILDLTDTRSTKKKLQDLGISTRQYAAWNSDPAFSDYLRKRSEEIINKEAVTAANLALMDKVRLGDVRAIGLALEYTGRFVPESKKPVENTAQVNFHSMMVKIIEIINEECEGDTAIRIADRFKTLLVANNMAAQLLQQEEDEITMPTIAKARELTPAVQALMDKTGGNT